MYERMLDKQSIPSIEEMTSYCGTRDELFTQLNQWLTNTYGTICKITFPYGNHYGWCVEHK